MKYAIVDDKGQVHVTSFSKSLLLRLFESAYSVNKNEFRIATW